MRSCIYCGRILEKGEVCTCPQSEAHRKQKNGDTFSSENTAKQQNSSSDTKTQNDTSQDKAKKDDYSDRTTYHTGYTQKQNVFERSRAKAHAKRAAKRNSGIDTKNLFSSLWKTFVSAFHSPVESVINPKNMSKGLMLTIWALQGAVTWLCMFFIMTNTARGPFSILASLLAFRGIEGYKSIMYMLLSVLSGAVGGIVVFFLYTGIFYAINRFIFRQKSTSYWDFCQRLSVTAIPFAVVAIAGTVLSIMSSTTLLILLLCGAASWIVLTYEALKTEWIMYSSGKILYGMMLGFFILFTLMCYFVRLS